MPLTEKRSSEKSIFIRPLLVAVLLAASLAAPMALPLEGVSALGGNEFRGGGGGGGGGEAFVARFGSEGSLAHPGELGPLAAPAGVTASISSSSPSHPEPAPPQASASSDSSSSSSSGSDSSSSDSSASGQSSSSSSSSESSSSSSSESSSSSSGSSGSSGSASGSESVSSFLACPSGFERFSVGLGSSGWGCRRVLSEASVSYSCLEGVLRISGDSRVCAWEEELVESSAASASCSPAGVPLSCRYVDAGGVSRFGSLRYGCPSGWVLAGSSCSRSTSVERTVPPAEAYSCERGVLVGSSCYEYTEAVRSCPPSWVLRASGVCERVVAEPARSAQSASSSVAAPLGPPGVPLNVSVLLGVESATLVWSPPGDDGGSPVSGYLLRWRVRGGDWLPPREPLELNASVRYHVFTNLVGGGSYQVRLWAKNAVGEGDHVFKGVYPCSAGQQILRAISYFYCKDAPLPRPPLPAGLGVAAGVRSLTASWGTPAASAGEVEADGFQVQWKERSVKDWSSVDLNDADVGSHVIGGLKGDVSYLVKVRSFNDSGEKRVYSYPAVRSGVTLADDPCFTSARAGYWDQVFDPGLGLCVGKPGPFSVLLEGGDEELSVSVRWDSDRQYFNGPDAVGGYADGVGRLGKAPVSEYEVSWKRQDTDVWSSPLTFTPDEVRLSPSHSSSLLPRGRFPGSSNYFVEDVHLIEGLTNGVSYDVKVVARNAAGETTVDEWDAPCKPPRKYNKGSSACLAPPPAAEAVVLTSGDQSLTLRWRQPKGAVVDGHRVELRFTGPSPFVALLDQTWLDWDDGVVKTVGGVEVREWSHTFSYETPPGRSQLAPAGARLRNGEFYYVRVVLYNSSGDGEIVEMRGSPCESCSTEVSTPLWSPLRPRVCLSGRLLFYGWLCLDPCPQGQWQQYQGYGSGSRCVDAQAPVMRGFSWWPGPRAGELHVGLFGWFVPGPRKQWVYPASSVSTFKVTWKRLGGSFPEYSTLIPPPAGGGRSQQYIISGLTVGARYRVSVSVSNSVGESASLSGVATVGCGVTGEANRVTAGGTRPPSNLHEHRQVFASSEGLCVFQPRPPAALAAAPTVGGSVNVTWEQHDWDNYYPVTGYQLQWRRNPQGGPLSANTNWTTVTPSVSWATGAAYTTAAGEPRRRFTQTINAVAGASVDVRVASLNQIPSARSEWATATATTCRGGEARLTATTGCADIPALPTASPPARTPTLTLHPGTGAARYITAAWWQNTGAFDPVEYTLEWKQSGAATWNTRTLPSAGVNVPLPPDTSYRGWTLNAYSLTGLDMCTHDVRVTAVINTQSQQQSATVSAAPQGTVTAPGAPQGAFALGRSDAGDQLYVYWKRPECDGGATLNQYQVSYKLTADTTWTDEPLITSAAELARVHNGHLITGLNANTGYDVRVTVRNSQNLTAERSRSGTTVAYTRTPISGAHVWRPYSMPPDQSAMVSERIQMGLTIRVCTSAADFVAPLQRTVAAWNAALADNQLNNPGVTPTARSDAAPAGAFEFSGTASAPVDCGEAGNSGQAQTDNQDFEAVFMDYREDCTTSGATPDVPTNDCDDTSCASGMRLSTVGDNCADDETQCLGDTVLACVSVNLGTGLRPRKTSAQVAQMVRWLSDGVFAHELGHYLLLVDYAFGCHWLDHQNFEQSLMSYGPDWSDYQRLINTQDPRTIECRSETITRRDQEDLNSMYHPAAFASLTTGVNSLNPAMEHFAVGTPPQDLNGNSHYNAYRYVILHRAPQGGSAAPNAFTPLMDGSTPEVLTPEDVRDAVAHNSILETSVDLNASAYTALRATGHEFVFVGVTRGDPQRDPGKSLNPVLAADLAHAIIPLDLGLAASTGLDGVRNWTLGTPVLYVHP